MKLKKAGAFALILGILLAQGVYIKSFAISENVQKVKKEKVKKTKKAIDKTDYINLNFWNLYNDDNLKFYIMKAFEANYDLKIASLNSEIYRNYITSQRAGELPSAGAGFSPAYTKMPNSANSDWSFALPLYVNYEADIFLKNHDKTKISKKNYEMSLLDEKSSYISVVSMVGVLYFNILRLNKEIELQEEIVSLRKEIYDLMVLSNNEGLVSTQDVIMADKSYIAGNSELINLKKEKQKLVNNLAVLTGTNPNETGDFQYSNLENVDYRGEIPTSISSNVIVNRPDYMKAEKNVEKSGLEVRVAKKEFLPSINITGLALFNASEFSSLLTTKNGLFGLSGMVLEDLFQGGRKIANLKIKKNEYEKALQLYEKTNLTAIQEVNDSLVAIKHDETKYQDAKKQDFLEEKNYSLRKLKYDKGVISRLDLIQSKENLLNVKKLVMSDKAECFIDYIGLYKASGGNFNL